MLKQTEWGRGDRLALAHGFTQNARCWGSFGRRLGDHHRVVAIDAPGHGQSGYDDADLETAGRMIVTAAGATHFLGYSMGGRMLLHAALAGDSIASLVLIGATAGIDDPADRSARRRSDDDLALQLLDLGTEAFIDRWLSGPLFAGLSAEQAARAERLANRPEGLAASLRSCGTGQQAPLWDRLHTISAPVLVIAGTHDTKFTALGERLVDSIGPNASFAPIAGGHAVHLEQPAETADCIEAWYRQAVRR